MSARQPRRKALIVAVTNRADNQQQLPGASTNAGLIIKLLSDVRAGGFDVRVLASTEATRAAILDALEHWLIAGSEEDDVLIFAVSAHGEMYHHNGLWWDQFIPGDFDVRDPRATNFVTWPEIVKIFHKLKQRPRPARLYTLYDCCRPERGPAVGVVGQVLGQVGRTWRNPPATLRAKIFNVDDQQTWIEIRSCQEDQNADYSSYPFRGRLTFTVELANALYDGLGEERPPTLREVIWRAFTEMWKRTGETQVPDVTGPKALLDAPVILNVFRQPRP